MTEVARTADEVSRWKCVSYCLCGTRRGHFERSDTGEWMRAADVLVGLPVSRGTVDASGLAFELRASVPATNQDLRSIAALLIAAADRLDADPEAVNTRIEA